MKFTEKLLLKLPEPTEFVLVEDLNENFTKIDKEIAKITDEETGVEAQLAKHLDKEATDTILGHVKQSKNNRGNTVVTRNTNGTIKATGGTSADEVLAVFWRDISPYTANATLVTSAIEGLGGVTYLLTVEIGVAATNAYHGMYLVHYQSTGTILTPIVPLNSEITVTLNSNYTITIKSTASGNRSVIASLVRVV